MKKKEKEFTTYEQNMKDLLAELAEKGYTSASLQADKAYLDRITADVIVPFLKNHLKNYCLGLMKPMHMTRMDGVGECTMKLLDKLDYILEHPAHSHLGLVQTISQNHIYSLYRSYVRHMEPTLTMDDPFWDVMADTMADAAENNLTSHQTVQLMAETIGSLKNLLVIIRLLAKICGVKKEKLPFALQKYGDVTVALTLMERTCQKLGLPRSVFPMEEIRSRKPNFYLTLTTEKLEKKIDNASSYAKPGLQKTYFTKKKQLEEQA